MGKSKRLDRSEFITLSGSNISIPSKLADEGADFREIRDFRDPSPDGSEESAEKVRYLRFVAHRMSAAIRRIEADYDPNLLFSGYLAEAKRELDDLKLETLADVDQWHFGWIDLIKLAKSQSGAGAEVKKC